MDWELLIDKSAAQYVVNYMIQEEGVYENQGISRHFIPKANDTSKLSLEPLIKDIQTNLSEKILGCIVLKGRLETNEENNYTTTIYSSNKLDENISSRILNEFPVANEHQNKFLNQIGENLKQYIQKKPFTSNSYSVMYLEDGNIVITFIN